MSADTNSRFKVISSFAGCGGSSLGYTLAGGKVLLAIEWDKDQAAIYRANFKDTKVYQGDIAKLSVEKCLEMADIKPGELDIFDGSPPCQGFSTAGKQDFSDERNQLFKEYVRLLRGIQPKVLVMENVSGLVKGKMRWIFAEILHELKESGYKTRAKLLNAAYYGVPQLRERVIFIGVREDLGIEPTFPDPLTDPIPTKEVLKDYLHETAEPINQNSKIGIQLIKTKQGKSAKENNPKGSLFSYRRLDLEKPAHTIMRGSGVGKLPGIIHPTEHRGLTVNELKALASFPEWFDFPVPEKEAVEGIGNCVPPLLSKAIAEHILVNILEAGGAEHVS